MRLGLATIAAAAAALVVTACGSGGERHYSKVSFEHLLRQGAIHEVVCAGTTQQREEICKVRLPDGKTQEVTVVLARGEGPLTLPQCSKCNPPIGG
jgi:hypothetical protein